MGRQLARENPIEADVVVPVPDSGNCAALGYSLESGIPYEMAFVRNHYVGRSFLQPSQLIRDFQRAGEAQPDSGPGEETNA